MALPASQPTTLPAPAEPGKTSITHHRIGLGDQFYDYDAIAGEQEQKDESGKTRADLFYVAYQLSGKARPAERPIMFCFNGGPGAASVWLHLGAAGPKSIKLDEKGLPVGPPYSLIDNTLTWLPSTDLVFIDPVSTGYSRPAPGEKADAFHGVRNDVQSVAQFIRLYLTQHQRWASPIYLAGESYGTTRGALLADVLNDQYGIAVSGVVLISSVLDFQTLLSGGGNDLPYEMYLPSYAAVAWYHRKLPADLQKDLDSTLAAARKFTVDTYTSALLKGSSLMADDRRHVVAQIARFTGLPADLIDRCDLRVPPGRFEKELLGDGHTIIGRFDGRVTGYDPDAAATSPSFDPSLAYYKPAYSAAFNDYVRRDLGYTNDLSYEVLTEVGPWALGGDGGTGYLNVIDNLQSALLKNPHLRVLFVSGLFDLATPYFAADYTVDRLRLNPDAVANVTHVDYPAGHMVYHDKYSDDALRKAIAAFVGGHPASTSPKASH